MSDFDCLHRQLPIVCTCRKWTTSKNRCLELVASHQSWRKIIQRCKNCSSHAPAAFSFAVPSAAYLTSFAAVAPFFRTKDPRVASRTDKFFNKALHTLAGVEDKDLSAYLNCKATACQWYLQFPPVFSPDCINDTKKVRDAEGPEEEDACDADVSRPMRAP